VNQVKVALFKSLFDHLSFALSTASIMRSSTGISSNQDHGEKMIQTTSDFTVWNGKQ